MTIDNAIKLNAAPETIKSAGVLLTSAGMTKVRDQLRWTGEGETVELREVAGGYDLYAVGNLQRRWL